MPKCKNNPTRSYKSKGFNPKGYIGTEPSPKGLG